MNETLSSLCQPKRLDAERFSWEVPDHWQQGRTAYGGLVMAVLVRALEMVHEDTSAPLRTLHVSLCGPVDVGAATLEVETLRAGSRMTTLAARLTQEGVVRTHAVGIFGQRRIDDGGTWNTRVPPEMPSWQDLPEAPIKPPISPTFSQHFSFRPTGPIPFSGVAVREAAGWIRARNPGPERDAACVAAHADAWWPAMLSGLTAPRPLASVSITIEFLNGFEGLDPQAPFFHVGRTPVATDGFVVELRELWGEDGRLIALNQQTQVIIK